MPRKAHPKEVADLDANGKALRKKFGGRGWLCERMSIEGIIRARHSPFLMGATNKESPRMAEILERFKDYPATLRWPSINDDRGMLHLIDAVMDRDIEELIDIQSQTPEFNFGIADYIRFLANGSVKGTAQRQMLRSKKLAHGHTLDVELVKNDDGDIVIRAAVRHLGRTLSTKILAKKPSLQHA